jgi:hypothetical protein
MKTTKMFKALPTALAMLIATAVGYAQDNQASGDLSAARPRFIAVAPHGHLGPKKVAGIPGIDSLMNFSGHYKTPGVGPTGKRTKLWYYNMVGRLPQNGGTTYINAPVVPVSLDLLNFDGNGNTLHYSVHPFILPTLYSPVFQNSTYTSSDVPTQFVDSVQRAEFYNVMKPNWHTVLNPNLKTERTMAVPAGSYFYKLKSDGSCCEFVLIDIDEFSNLLFPSRPSDTTTPVGAAENAGDITTKDMATFLFPNTFLYFDGDPNQCCVLGFHSYDFEPGDANNGNKEKRYVLNYASWISPGLFGGGFEDVTALSHEVAETYNDPFVTSDNLHNITPWWLSPNGNCQDDLEVGDVIEGLSQGVFPVTMNGRTYHPQNEALLQWFEFQSPSTALGGAYSYPNQNTLTALSPAEGVRCQ